MYIFENKCDFQLRSFGISTGISSFRNGPGGNKNCVIITCKTKLGNSTVSMAQIFLQG